MKDNIVYYQTKFLLNWVHRSLLPKISPNGDPFSELTHLQPASQLNNPMSKPLMNLGQHSVVDQVTAFCNLSIFDGMPSIYHVYNTVASNAWPYLSQTGSHMTSWSFTGWPIWNITHLRWCDSHPWPVCMDMMANIASWSLTGWPVHCLPIFISFF